MRRQDDIRALAMAWNTAHWSRVDPFPDFADVVAPLLDPKKRGASANDDQAERDSAAAKAWNSAFAATGAAQEARGE